MDNLVWQIPLTVFSTLVVTRVIIAPYLLYSEREKEVTKIVDAFSEKVEGLTSELARPKFKLTSPQVYETDEIGDEAFGARFEYCLENIGSRSACPVATNVFTFEVSLDKPPTSLRQSIVNEVAMNDPLTLRLSLGDLSMNEPAYYFVIAVRYVDSITQKEYSQRFFVKWAGVRRGSVSSDISHQTIEERRKVEAYLADLLKNFETDANLLEGLSSPKLS